MMGRELHARLSLALTGAVGGALFWLLIESDGGNERLGLVLATALGTFLATAFAMAGPLGLLRAAPRAAGLAAVTAGLVGLASLRWADPGDFFATPLPSLAALVVASLPVPFLIAWTRPDWRDYPALFAESWAIVVRSAAALAFVGLVWLMVFLSDEVLQIVGITLIGELIDSSLAVLVLTGAALGLGMAVVYEFAGTLAPHLVLRLFRLLLPVVLAVVAVFLVALALRGMDGLASGLSPAMLLLTMVGAGILLVSITVDRSDAEAAANSVLLRAAQGMALVLPVLAGLALWALWQRIDQHGMTPQRLFLALVAGVGLGYGLVYAVAVLRGAGWMGRIRRGNLGMALAVIALAALWLTPVLNAERLSAQNQLARFDAGRTAVADLDLWALGGWGHAGEAVRAALEERAKAPGQEALAARLRGDDEDPATGVREARAADLAAVMPVQPPGATGTRDMLLAAAESWLLEDWLAICNRRLADTATPACVMLVADLLPALPGEEALVILERAPGQAEARGVYIDPAGFLALRDPVRPDGRYLTGEAAAELLRAAQVAPLPLTPALVNQLGTGETGLFFPP